MHGMVHNGHFSSQTLLNKDRQCCELWREVELGVHAVWAVFRVLALGPFSSLGPQSFGKVSTLWILVLVCLEQMSLESKFGSDYVDYW